MLDVYTRYITIFSLKLYMSSIPVIAIIESKYYEKNVLVVYSTVIIVDRYDSTHDIGQ